MTSYQAFLVVVLIAWPFAIGGLLIVMSRLEWFVQREAADSPDKAGLQPVAGTAGDREVRIVFGDQVVSEPD